MIIDRKDYKNMSVENIATNLEYKYYQSVICGKYEYFVSGYFGHEYTKVEVNGEREIVLFRRDLTSINDEILRYAEYCRYWVETLYNYVADQVKKYPDTGVYDYPEIPNIYAQMKKEVICRKLNTDPKYAIEAKKQIEKYYPMVGENHPWYNKEPVWYTFYNDTLSPEEIELKEFYEKKKKKMDDDYWLKREELHFKYLDEQLEKIGRLRFDSSSGDVSRSPLKSFWFVASIIGMTFFVFTILGLPSVIQEQYPSSSVAECILLSIGIAFVFSPAFLIFGLKMGKFRRWKKDY